MKRVGRKDTGAEVALRKAIFAYGKRFRVNYKIAGIRVDIALPRYRLAIFVDGCFWHCCPIHGTKPKTNLGYWLPKLSANKERDRRQTRIVRRAGWKVVRLWEHECKSACEAAAKKVLRAISDSGN
jgi:DNA mismatch endonuclease (patch repair protein)